MTDIPFVKETPLKILPIIGLAATIVVQIAAPAVADAQGRDAGPGITPYQNVFAIIVGVDGDNLTLKAVHALIARNPAEGAIMAGDTITATLEPIGAGNTRRAACVTAIHGALGALRIVPGTVLSDFPRPGCLAAVHDFEGRAGLPVSDVKPGTATRLLLNANLIATPKQ